MKNIVLLFILSILITFQIHAQNYWIKTASPTAHQLTKFVFTDIQNLWAVGDTGTIIHTSNGGVNWVLQNSNYSSDYKIKDVFFLNLWLGWCVVSNYYNDASTIIKTTNGGNNWFSISSPDSAIASIYFTDSLHGVLAEWNGKIFKTTNAGFTWTQANIFQSQFIIHPFLSLRFYNSQYGMVSGGIHEYSGLIYRTTDYGSDWIICDSTLIDPVNDLCYIDSNIAMGCGGDYDYGVTYALSSDRGVNWKNVYLPYLGFGKAIAPRTHSEIWLAMGPSEKWAATFDSTNTWRAFQSLDSISINYCKFIDDKHGWTVGGNGIIYKYDTSLIGIEIKGNIIPVTFKLYQNYPNPFNPLTKIKFTTPFNPPEGGRQVQLIIYDILGREVATLVNEKLNIGTYEIVWDASNYPSGIYFYELRVGSFSETKKMVLIK